MFEGGAPTAVMSGSSADSLVKGGVEERDEGEAEGLGRDEGPSSNSFSPMVS